MYIDIITIPKRSARADWLYKSWLKWKCKPCIRNGFRLTSLVQRGYIMERCLEDYAIGIPFQIHINPCLRNVGWKILGLMQGNVLIVSSPSTNKHTSGRTISQNSWYLTYHLSNVQNKYYISFWSLNKKKHSFDISNISIFNYTEIIKKNKL